MAREGLLMLYLAAFGDFEALCSSAIGLHLGHLARLSSKFFNAA
jgi:hypothetical protein